MEYSQQSAPQAFRRSSLALEVRSCIETEEDVCVTNVNTVYNHA